MITHIPSWIYQQFDADFSLEYPGEGFGGWKKIDAPFDLDRCAVILMHAWEIQSYEEIPGHWRCVEYVPRAEKICKELLPSFLEKVRASGVRLIHVADQSMDIEHYPGYKKTLQMTGIAKTSYPKIKRGEAADLLVEMKNKYSSPGEHNEADIIKGRAKSYDFNKYAIPKDDELIAINGEQLFSLCDQLGIDHVIYTGFANNFCLMYGQGGWLEMIRHGIISSVIKELTSAVENKESCREERHKEYGLWNLAMSAGGVVLEEEDFLRALQGRRK